MTVYAKEAEFSAADWAAAIEVYTDPSKLQSPPDRENSYMVRGTDGSAYAVLAYMNHPVHGPGFGLSVFELGDNENTPEVQERVNAWLRDFVQGRTNIGTMVDYLNASPQLRNTRTRPTM